MNTWDINILVNGNRCKQYQHEGKTFVQANPGSEYAIEIKNNYYKRILAVSSVDGLNVLTGKTASETDSGYLIDAYHSEKIKGFRISDDEWALFKFGYKFNGKTYAQSKNDGSEKNCGVVGLRLFYEKEYPYCSSYTLTSSWSAGSPLPQYMPHINVNWGGDTGDGQWIGGGVTCQNMSLMSDVSPTINYCASSPGVSTRVDDIDMSKCSSPLRSMSGATRGRTESRKMSNATNITQKSFDMGTEWGKKEASKVHTVAFETGLLAHTFDIYYASRESLIEMGIPLDNKLKSNLPQSFPTKYAQPPAGWVG